MLHAHVVAFLDHRVLVGYVCAGADRHVSARLMYVAVESLVLEPPLARVEHHCVLEVLVAGLAERARAASRGSVRALDRELAVVLARPWDLELEGLAVEDLVRVETRRGTVKANFLA